MAEDYTMEVDTQVNPPKEVATDAPRPLYIDLWSQVDKFLGDLNLSSTSSHSPISIPDIFFSCSASNQASVSIKQLLQALSSLASYPGVFNHVQLRFQPILMDLLARWIEESESLDYDLLERRLSILSLLVEINPEFWSLVHTFILRTPFRNGPLALVDFNNLPTIPTARLHILLLIYLRLIIVDPSIATRNNWPITQLYTLRTDHPDQGLRLLAIQVLARQQKWSEKKRMEAEKTFVGNVADIDAEVLFGFETVILPQGGFQIQEVKIDGWMLPVIESKRINEARRHAAKASTISYLHVPVIDRSDLCSRIVLVADQLMLRSSALNPLFTTMHTHILQYLSSMLFPSQRPSSRILTIPLADTSIDVKSLIGTYVSSPNKPGTFEWMEGALAKAIRAGRWVVFEDVDRGSTEMLVTLAGIARSLRSARPGQRAMLAVPGRVTVEAGDGFGLFVTRTTRQEHTAPTFYAHHIFSEVFLAAPSDEDILAILTARFQRLPKTVLTTLVNIWHELRPFDKLSGQVKARDIGLRDLEKWCARVERNLPSSASLVALEQSGSVFANSVLQDEIFLEGVDIFVASLDTKKVSREKRKQMVDIIARGLGMDEDRFMALDSRKPNFEVSPASRQLHIGRVIMDMGAPEKGRRDTSSSARPFALTKPSLILLERIAVSLTLGEPTLLVGETGTGKTTAVQHIASIVRRPLTVLNLSMQTESSDLLGGFKPIDASVAARSIHARWQKLFCETFAMGKPANGAYVEAASRALSGRKWARCAELWTSSAKRAIDKLGKGEINSPAPEGSPLKRRKIFKATRVSVQWQTLLADISDFDLHHAKMKSKLVFSFVEGPLVKAMKSGEWLLLDEVNLASQETLEAISTILEGPTASLVLTERGDVEPVARHPQFRLFACMNPATDVGKKDLPPNLRTRFTELYVPPPDDDREALISIIAQYLGDAVAGEKSVILDIAELYTTLKRLSAAKEIVDGSNAPPHYSMRTLARALTFAVQSAPLFGLRRALWEGYLMAFTMSLDVASARIAREAGEKYILGPMKNASAVLAQIPALPSSMDPDNFIRFGPFWLQRGPVSPVPESRYIITPSVQSKLSDLARVILTKRYPVLIQGPTSAGKTSAVEFLARQTGHRFVRINNHEHTDIQEYLGTYVTDPHTGHWIVLDELNLAPTDVLEALNRLLDDNRELVIPETQEVIKPHPNFILFATQNPPGLYAGRKILSRAFRNRFLEVHFDDVPKHELETILCQRCQIAPTYAKKIVQVFEELRHRRQASRVFESKQSFATLRDLFRWAERGAIGYQQLAEDGYMLLAERARQEEDKVVIKQVIEQVMKVTINDDMYRLFDKSAGILARFPQTTLPPTSMVWTKAMQRLFALVAAALLHNEPVLLVGETGCGKTSVCEIVAHMFNQALVGINCHQNMETADLLGSQRPVRNKLDRRAKVISTLGQYVQLPAAASDDEILDACATLAKTQNVDHQLIRQCQREIKQLSALFEWSDGPLVHAMTAGDLLLLDEVSLADDSVLERLNSVLEPGRTLVLAEKGGIDIDEATIVANERFHVVATMNPGGDFGKKELSPALRNRFTEIWVPALNDRGDMLQIINQSWKHENLRQCGPLILDYFLWFGKKLGDSSGLGLRDILAWVSFGNDSYAKGLSVPQVFHHGGQMVLIDGLESLPQVAGMSSNSIETLRKDCLAQLDTLAASLGMDYLVSRNLEVKITQDAVSIAGFLIPRGSMLSKSTNFRFEAPTTALNTMRLVRGCQLPKAILLEGSPGVGKTSLVSALAGVAGYHLHRINLSDQTDLIDLFGSDLPVEGGKPGEFQWRDAAFLEAMQKGEWVLLDEMNLASQTVLEGLNAVLDHRGTVYIPELGRSFSRHPDFRVFAAQNPLQQGGGRKGLPKSFLNRFTKVYLQEHTAQDLMIICRNLLPMPTNIIEKMISFNDTMRIQTMITRVIGREGSPWEFNLRDLFRWFSLLSQKNGLERTDHPAEFFQMVYRQRFRNERDRQAVTDIFHSVFGHEVDSTRPFFSISPSWMQVGHSIVSRGSNPSVDVTLPHHHLDIAESILKGIELGWLVILAGDSGAGKRGLIRGLAKGAGRLLGEFAMHPGVDTSEILGSFEQQDVSDAQPAILRRLEDLAVIREQCQASFNVETLDAFSTLSQAILSELSSFIDVSLARQSLDSLIKVGPNAMGFAWVDGELIHAIKNGGWYLISDANLCSASVLDRLNSLCESNGVLVLSEKGSSTGSPEVLRPHQDFRLFMTYDPHYGELSRAMRNRGLELFLDGKGMSKSVKRQPLILADDSVLRELTVLQSTVKNESEGYPISSAVASSISLQSQGGLAYLPRFSHTLTGSVGEGYSVLSQYFSYQRLDEICRSHAVEACSLQRLDLGFVGAMPVDLTLNPNIRAVSQRRGAINTVLQTILRGAIQLRHLQSWIADPAHAKTILALSAVSSRRGPSRPKVQAGGDVYPFIISFLEIVQTRLASLVSESPHLLQRLDRVFVYVLLMISHAKSSVFDYSSTKLLARWIEQDTEGITSLCPVLDKLQNLAKTVQLTTGLGQTEIWSLFRETCDQGSSEDLVKLTSLADDVYDPHMKYSILQAFATLGDTPRESTIIQELTSLLTTSRKEMKEKVSGRWTNWPITDSLKLQALCNKNSQDVLKILLEDISVKVSSLLPLQNSLGPTHSPAALFEALSGWMKGIWDHSDCSEGILSGPADLFKPARLSSTLRFGLVETVTMAEIPDQDQALNFSVKTILFDAENKDSRRKNTLDLAVHCLSLILSAFGVPCLATQVTPTSMASVEDALDKSIDNPAIHFLHQSYHKWITPAFSEASLRPHDLTNIGQVWLALSRFLLDLYVTNIPIDPGVRRGLQGEVIAEHLALVKEELAALTAKEMVLKGKIDSKLVADLMGRASVLEKEEESLGPNLKRASDVLKLSYLFNEVHAFLSDLYDRKHMCSLISALQDTHIQAMSRERDFQLGSSAFIQRLSTTYSEMSDLVHPVVTAVLFGKFGLRLIARDVQLRGSRPDSTVPLAVTFPLARGVKQLQKLSVDSPVDQATGVPTELLAASAYLYELNTTQSRIYCVPRLAQRLDRLYQIWSAIRLREQQEAQDAESLYKVKKTDIEVLSDEEQEAKEFAELFPQYEDAGAEDALPKQKELHLNKENQKGFQPSHVASFNALIRQVFGQSSSTSSSLLKQMIDETLHTNFNPVALDERLDASSLAFQISTLHRRLADVRTSPSQPNFYLSPNEPEAQQMVLVHIRDRCERILTLDTRSPVAKILIAMEQLLIHTEDWEAYANRENSLSTFRDETSKLIIEWRKLELVSWTRLLDDQAEHYASEDNEWTLRLYGALIHGPIGSNDAGKHIEEVLPMVSTYINSSTYGLFTPRLDLLSCFQRMASELSIHHAVLGKVATMLHNVIANARLFESRISDAMASQRAVIDKAVKDFVKLASWKDVNVFALKASAQKSHKALHRSIRKFRDVLRQPIAPLMSELNRIVPQETPVSSEPPPPFFISITTLTSSSLKDREEASPDVPDVLVRLEETLDRYGQVHLKLRDTITGATASLVDSMAVDIIETASSLAKQTPSALTKENEKVVNNLASRKRKAYADMLKALRASGFSQNVRADQMSRQQSSAWLATQLPVSIECMPSSFDTTGAAKVENYHHRLEILMSAMRAAFNGHNPDIASQDLQRGIGFVESIYASSLNERARIVSHITPLSKLYAILERLNICARSTSVIGGQSVLNALQITESWACQIDGALREIEDGVRQFRGLQGRQCLPDDLISVRELRQESSLLIRALATTLESVGRSECLLFTNEEYTLLKTASRIRIKLLDRFQSQASSQPEFKHLFDPVVDMVQQTSEPSVSYSISGDMGPLWIKSDEVVQALLVVAQQMKSNVITDQQNVMITSLRIVDVIERLSSFTTALASTTSPFVPNCLSRIVPFLEIFIQTYIQSISAHIHTVKATYKLCYVVGRVVLDLSQKGFCKPQEEGDSGEGEDGDMVEGTGMGAGTGEKNVSQEIKEESQVEGLQGEEEEEQEEQGGEEDDAFSMDEDFKGEMGEGKEKEEGSGDEEEEEEDHDEHVGDVDPLDPGAVDEKFWGEEQKEEEKKESDELMDQQTQDREGESEMTGKEDEKKEKKDNEKQKQGEEAQEEDQSGQKQDEGGEEGKEGEELEDEEVMGEERNEEGEEQPVGQDQQEASVPEGDTLDLPEDLNLDDDGLEDGQDQEEILDDDMGMSIDGDEENDEDREGEEIDRTNEDEGEEVEEAPAATAHGEDETEEEAQMGQDADLSAANEQAQESEVGKGVGGGLEGDSDRQKEEKKEEEGETEEIGADAQGQDGAAPQSQQQQTSTSDQQQADGPVDSAGAPLPSDNQSQPQLSRSLGDILQEIRRRHDEILSQQEREEQPSDNQRAPEETSGQVEYVKEDEAKEDDQQALGKAGDEERQKLEDLKIVDEEETGEERQAMEDGPEEKDVETEARDHKPADSSHQTRGESDNEKEQTEKALTQADISGKPAGEVVDDGMDVDEEVEGGVERGEIPADDNVDEPDLNILDPAPITNEVAAAEDLWRRYATMTSDLSYALCEQLRLILEPTLATRLQGDFRTGKRLNMRKIIPYIASEYTKDKIWLRRTKPSRREYQVLLSLDDSRSMSESHSVDLAYQTLALVSQAMNKLEVGQEGGFTDADGAKIMSSFKFDQQKTDVASLVERTLGYLSEARNGAAMSATAPDLWQLQIIISDGVCQDHARLKRLLRRALEERVMIVFIIVDSLHQTTAPSTAPAGTASASRPSILSMQTVEYKNVNGEMKLEMQRYLDTFPFEFYVVLRDVEALPGVLADTLRQWMTRVSQSQE
ncbi:hypothetical protein CNBJ2090 [Cryptococcus deneoformans B-3501A]|uniref:hypothetical protein n=1 Tax=Cryptococcus deneoformans (strain B-3501A) TaxID=283643 RepID=UPI0000430360|nr:hypothetical protein CNBJ2090 [Cryptococcus neoformans var. neoformans B-3501A]EAL18568.1 hypothetical protein CNBJ2090 [Cryptococcus neoformans var. neoformans B-3501A]